MAALNQAQDGDIFGIIWVWASGRGAHTIYCEIVNGKPVFIDAQDGTISPILDSSKISRSYGFSFYKMEKARLNQNIDWNSIIRKVTP